MQWTWLGVTAALGFAGAAFLANGPVHRPHSNQDQPGRLNVWMIAGDDAADRRRAMLQSAAFEYDAPPLRGSADLIGTSGLAGRPPAESRGTGTHEPGALAAWRSAVSNGTRSPDDPLDCRFLPSPPSGTSPKFDCALAGGDVVKVKYGRNPEIHAETAATALLRRLNYPADDVTIVPRLRCYACPRFPFATMALVTLFGVPVTPEADDGSFQEFTWVSVERKFPAPAIETADESGWAWWELAGSRAPRTDVDALRLTAMFLAHWDNKSENQRLVCLDDPLPPPAGDCRHPLAMIQDLGATFGPTKANLARWRELPVWSDRATCTISMAAMPHGGGSFPDGRVSEGGRAKLAARLATISDAEIARLFDDARFPEFQIGTDDAGDLKAWVDAFRHRADQIVHTTCPALPEQT